MRAINAIALIIGLALGFGTVAASAQTVYVPSGSTVVIEEGNRQIIYAAPRPRVSVEVLPSAPRSVVTYHDAPTVIVHERPVVVHRRPVVVHSYPRSSVSFGIGVHQFGGRSATSFNFGFTEVR